MTAASLAGNRQRILEVHTEGGGSLSIVGRRDTAGAWSYAVQVNEARLLDQPDATAEESGAAHSLFWLTSWPQALSHFDKYGWHRLRPSDVHPDFARQIAQALLLRGIDLGREARWRKALVNAGWDASGADHRFPAFSARYDAALTLSAVVHSAQDRKGTSIPYSAHPVHVSTILANAGLDENMVIAGLLHDVVEDVKPVLSVLTRLRAVYPDKEWADEEAALQGQLKNLIESEFGPGVLKLIEGVSERKTEKGSERPWKDRKLEQLRHLRGASPGVALLKCADALHNAASILRDMQTRTDDGAREVLKRFNAVPDDILWYHGSVAAIVSERLLPEHRHLASQTERAVRELEREVDRVCGRRDPFNGERPAIPRKSSHGIVLQSRSGRRIYSFEQWRRFAPPVRGDAQWKDYRSAKELARAWFSGVEPEVPDELALLFRSSALTTGVVIRTLIAERETPLDARGPGRKHDLFGFGTNGDRKVVIGIEGKADESFGPAIGDYLDETAVGNKEREALGRRQSSVPQRIGELSNLVFGRRVDDEVRALRYQLLHAAAAMALESRKADVALLVVHEFLSKVCDRRRVSLNATDLAEFCRVLDSGSSPQRAGQLAGPFTMAGCPVPLLVGKVARTLRFPAEQPALDIPLG